MGTKQNGFFQIKMLYFLMIRVLDIIKERAVKVHTHRIRAGIEEKDYETTYV